ncbi:MAG: hypothetical protein PHT31_06995 [Candidatus Omnitrophica bacterium]|nr:hypothetical protein [Candidatus Omnitrophota bacterium]
MKKILVLLLCLGLFGCASSGYPITKPDVYKADIGMTREQVYQHCGSPIGWTRQIIDGKTYESWTYNPLIGTYDFVDGILVGYSKREAFGEMKYYSKDKVDDIKNIAK